MRNYQVAGLASSGSDRYDIVATAGGPASNAELRAMPKTLLADRFQLKVRTETRSLPAHRLIIVMKGPRLTRAVAGQLKSYELDSGSVVFHATSMPAFADYLSRRGPIDRPVIDGTGIEGAFDFKLKLFEGRPDMPLNELKRAYYDWDQGSSIFWDLQEQLGMKVQPERVPMEILVIDSVSKSSEN